MRKVMTLVVCLAALLGAKPAQAQSYRVIVNAANPTSQLSKDELQRVYLKKMTSWKDGSQIQVVDQSPRSQVRAQFSMAVLGRDVPTMKNYWQQSLFSGRGVPPIEQGNDAQVASYVAFNPGAIAYVSADASLPGGVKVIAIK
jgi:ABC-type phosphate transport system substrate-binding protein